MCAVLSGLPEWNTHRCTESCEKEQPIPLYKIDGEYFHQCPWQTIPQDVAMLYSEIQQMKNLNVMPIAGGFFDQSNLWIQASGIVNQGVNEANKAKHERAEALRNKGGR